MSNLRVKGDFARKRVDISALSRRESRSLCRPCRDAPLVRELRRRKGGKGGLKRSVKNSRVPGFPPEP